MRKERRKKNIEQVKTKHDLAIEELEEKVRGQYQGMCKNFYFDDPSLKGVVYELDLVGITDQEIHIYEVKTGDSNYKRAVEQLRRAKRILNRWGDVKTFYYSAKTKEIKPVE